MEMRSDLDSDRETIIVMETLKELRESEERGENFIQSRICLGDMGN